MSAFIKEFTTFYNLEITKDVSEYLKNIFTLMYNIKNNKYLSKLEEKYKDLEISESFYKKKQVYYIFLELLEEFMRVGYDDINEKNLVTKEKIRKCLVDKKELYDFLKNLKKVVKKFEKSPTTSGKFKMHSINKEIKNKVSKSEYI